MLAFLLRIIAEYMNFVSMNYALSIALDVYDIVFFPLNLSSLAIYINACTVHLNEMSRYLNLLSEK